MNNNQKDKYNPHTTPYTGTGQSKGGLIRAISALPAPLPAPVAATTAISPFRPSPSIPISPPSTFRLCLTVQIPPVQLASKIWDSIVGFVYLKQRFKALRDPILSTLDLPGRHNDFAEEMSSKDTVLKISLLHFVKGNIHDDMEKVATSREFRPRELNEQVKSRGESVEGLTNVEEAIRAWEPAQTKRAGGIPSLP
ncbi:hypothetical protein F5B22DRAFT_613842 [Xylaria bambusicola]|uniref:uncharacterized protein n=1 Tax=Xylaria bambusicola TaxID=326684 RepID=UPI002007CEC4|nr:uncharacterized protein F5B22DRAFT_613842 [Xylaria bambusicola]KAI0512709.1 hypothetical protein F5B22DRAFT_613842 [Xylaria bambusicola]